MSSINNIITDFQLIYQKILDMYQSSLSNVEKWDNISTYIHENHNIIIKIFAALKKQKNRQQIKIVYEENLSQLQKKISHESDPVVKASVIIAALHFIIYELLSSEGNYYLSLDGQKEMHILKKKITYYINLNAKPEKNINFHAFILLYALESLFNKHFYVGIDFEYTQRKIELAQLNFEHNISLQSFIMIVSPNMLDPIITDSFVGLIICNKYIKKILHGSDSLDIPYMFNHLLKDDSNQIRRFTRALIDTRFLCEYYKLTRDLVADNKCSIYDEDPTRSAVYFFNLISDEEHNRLNEILGSLPPHQDLNWNIKKLTSAQVMYAQYDVIFLKYFYYRIIYVATEDEETDVGKRTIIDLYKHVLNELTRVVYLENNNITYLKTKCKEEVDAVNNYFIRSKNGIIKMIDIYNKVSINLDTVNPRVSIDKLIKVSHFKSFIMIIIKRIVYGHISYKCRVQKDKMTIWTDKLNNQFIFDFLEQMGYHYLLRMFKELDKNLENRVKQICSS